MSRISLNDPNVKLNRILGDSKLLTWHALVADCSEKTIEHLDDELMEGQDQCSDILRRYEYQSHILKGVMSELHAANLFVSILHG